MEAFTEKLYRKLPKVTLVYDIFNVNQLNEGNARNISDLDNGERHYFYNPLTDGYWYNSLHTF